MKILIAEDDALFRDLLKELLSPTYDLLIVEDGNQAWQALQEENAPELVILDWVMPGLTGPQVCRKVRAMPESASSFYLILLTVKNSPGDLAAGFQAGADDYVTKPFDSEEVMARLKAGARVVELRRTLKEQAGNLQGMARRVELLEQLLPVCRRCRLPRVDRDFLQRVEGYLDIYSDSNPASHYCPSCLQTLESSGLPQEHALPGVGRS